MQSISKDQEIELDAQSMGKLLLDIARVKNLRDPILGEAAAESRLSPTQIHTVMWLGNDGPLTMGDLARRGGITEKTITGVIDRLERDGYVHRERDLADRRVVRVVLTEKGATEFREMRAVMEQRFRIFLGFLDAEDRQALLRILSKLHARLAAQTTNTTGGKEQT
jgi:DNA-binding MarR family transcriptional regulator